MSTPSIEILDFCETPIGLLCLRRRELLSVPGTIVTEVTIDHEFLMSSHNTVSERELATRAIDFHGGEGLRVLVGGLGLGYTAREAAGSPRVATVRVVELLPQVIAWLENGLVPLADELRGDESVAVVEDDIFRLLAGEPEERWDAILLDVDHNPEELLVEKNGRFYTQEGLTIARDHLNENGVLAVWSSAGNAVFTEELEKVFVSVKEEPIVWFNSLIDEEQNDALFLARR